MVNGSDKKRTKGGSRSSSILVYPSNKALDECTLQPLLRSVRRSAHRNRYTVFQFTLLASSFYHQTRFMLKALRGCLRLTQMKHRALGSMTARDPVPSPPRFPWTAPKYPQDIGSSTLAILHKKEYHKGARPFLCTPSHPSGKSKACNLNPCSRLEN